MSDISQPQASLWEQIKPYVATPWTITILAPILVAILDPGNLENVVSFAIRAFMGTLPYITFAVLLIAGLKAAGAEAGIARAFQGRENKMIVLAALFGGLAPFCSCEVIPPTRPDTCAAPCWK